MSPKLLTAVALLATAGMPVFAADKAEAPAPATFDKVKDCEFRREDNLAQLEAVRKARPDEAAMRAKLVASVSKYQANSICLADLLAEGDDDIANLLAAVASTDDNIDPAAGPDEGGAPAADFGPTDNAGDENPSQLNEPVTGPSASPVSPQPVLEDEGDLRGEIFAPTFQDSSAL